MKYLALILFILLPFIGFALGAAYQDRAGITQPTNLRTRKHTSRIPTGIPTSAPVTDEVIGIRELSTEEYADVLSQLLSLTQKQNPKVALDELSERMNTNTAVMRSCHGLAHDIGHAAYEKYKTFERAVVYQDDTCGSGFLHGIIESHFKNIDDVTITMKSICNDDDGRCFHGVGHGLMYALENDMPQSLSFCDQYETKHARSNCSDGVFMENFASEGKLHPSLYLRKDQPLYPCSEQKTEHKASCYFYAPRYFLSLHTNEYTEALRLCASAETTYQWACASGVGSIAMKQNMNSPGLVEQICLSGSTSQRPACIDGMVSYYMVNYNSPVKTKLLCEQMELFNQDSCTAAIRARESVLGIMTQR